MERQEIINKNRHFHTGLPSCFRKIYQNRKTNIVQWQQRIAFSHSCMALTNDENQLAWSKLGGFCFGIFGTHKNSIRFGWRFNPNKPDIIEISYIYYHKGNVARIYLCDIKVSKFYTFIITYRNNIYFLTIQDNDKTMLSITVGSNYTFTKKAFNCGFYYGGKTKAPQQMSIIIDE